MNKIIMIGRLTRDIELRYTTTEKAVARFSIAVDRPYAKKEAEVTADFFNVCVWGKRAETCANYLKKGLKVAIEGRLQNNNYTDNNGVKHYAMEIIAENVEFIEWEKSKKDDPNEYRAIDDSDVPF